MRLCIIIRNFLLQHSLISVNFDIILCINKVWLICIYKEDFLFYIDISIFKCNWIILLFVYLEVRERNNKTIEKATKTHWKLISGIYFKIKYFQFSTYVTIQKTFTNERKICRIFLGCIYQFAFFILPIKLSSSRGIKIAKCLENM